MCNDENGKTPYSILKILTKRLNDECPGYDSTYPLPKIDQIRNWKKKNSGKFTGGTEEYDKVTSLVNDLIYNEESTDEKKAFSYGAKMGTGSDNDPLIVCFSSIHLLKNISKYAGHYAIFHIDGTYKLIKNRFPVIAYGRSDTNGRLHLISVAICSNETTETYTHFYKYTYTHTLFFCFSIFLIG